MGWYQAYKKLQTFITKHPEIQITSHVITLPEHVRPNFYRLFNQVRKTFVKEQLPNLPRETQRLRENYFTAEGDVKRLLNLEEISVPMDLYKFLNDAKDRLAQDLFNLVFNLLKEQIDTETFEKEAAKNLKRSYRELFQWTYQKWMILSLVRLLKANKIFFVTVPPIEMTSRGPKIVIEPQSIPKPKESRQLSLLHDTTPVFIAPDFIIYSPLIHQFVSVGTEIGNLDMRAGVMWKAAEVSPGREWYTLEALEPLWMRCSPLDLRFDLMIYTHEKIEDLALIADSERICRPDLILVWLGRDDSLGKTIEKASLYKTFLNPKRGTFIVSQSPSKKLPQDKLDEGTFLIPIGFNQAKMNSIIGALSIGIRI